MRKIYNRDYFKVWSSDMSYTLGFLCADGNITKNKQGGYYVALYSADLDVLTLLARSFGSEHKISKRSLRSGNVYRIQVGSKEWFEDLSKLGIYPNKTKRLCLPTIPTKYVADFIRGYFDGDGNVWMGEIHKKRKNKSISLQVHFTCASVEFLRSLHDLLRSVGVRGGSIYEPKKATYARLLFSTKDALTIFKIMYNSNHELYLSRKKEVFIKFQSLRS